MCEILPELAYRLSEPHDVELLFLRHERQDELLQSLNPQDFRNVVGASCACTKLSDLSRLVMASLKEPVSGILACDVLSRPPAYGNIVEISLARVAPPVADPGPGDFFARLIGSHRRALGIASADGIETAWGPEMLEDGPECAKVDEEGSLSLT